MTTLKRVLLSTVCLVLSCMTACGPGDESALVRMRGNWDVTLEVRPATFIGDPTVPEPEPAIISTRLGATGETFSYTIVSGLCNATDLTFGGSEVVPYWHGSLDCGPLPSPACADSTLTIETLSVDSVTHTTITITGTGWFDGCGMHSAALVRGSGSRS